MCRSFFILLALITVTGCVSIPEPGEPFSLGASANPQDARVFFYRPNTFFMSAVELNIFVDGELVRVLSNGTFSSLYLKAGEHVFTAREKPTRGGAYSAALGGAEFQFQYGLSPGQDYFIGWYPSNKLFSEEDPEFFVVSDKKNPDVFETGLLLDIQGEFGIVNPEEGIQEISKTRLSNSLVEPDRI